MAGDILANLLWAIIFAVIGLILGAANIIYRKFFPKKTVPFEIESLVKTRLNKEGENIVLLFCDMYSIDKSLRIVEEVEDEYLKITDSYKVCGKEDIKKTAVDLLKKTIATIRISRNVSTKDNKVLSDLYECCNTLYKK